MNNFFLVIPTRNRLDYLSNLLLDLNAFKNNISQVVIIDQSHNDISQEIAKLNLEYNFVFEKNSRNNSVNNSRNQALKHYNNEEWLFFLDDDLRIPAIAFDKILKHLEPNVIDVLIPGIGKEYLESKKIMYSSLLESLAKPNDFSKSRMRIQVCSGLSIAKASIFLKAGFWFDENFSTWGDDWDFGMRLTNSGAIIYYQPDILIEHLWIQSGGQRDKAKTIDFEFENQMLYFYFIRKHFSDKVIQNEFLLILITNIYLSFKKFQFLNIFRCIKAFKKSKLIKIQ